MVTSSGTVGAFKSLQIWYIRRRSCHYLPKLHVAGNIISLFVHEFHAHIIINVIMHERKLK